MICGVGEGVGVGRGVTMGMGMIRIYGYNMQSYVAHHLYQYQRQLSTLIDLHSSHPSCEFSFLLTTAYSR